MVCYSGSFPTTLAAPVPQPTRTVTTHSRRERDPVDAGYYADEIPAIAQHPVKGTGQLAQAELGLDYYVARWYDPVLGHFTQADTLVPEPGKASAFDRYAYVLNNPLRYNDPSGHDVGCAGTDADNCSELNKHKDRRGYSVMTKQTKTYVAESILGNNKTTWNQASPEYRELLSSAGWNQFSWDNSDFLMPGVRDAYWYEDPVMMVIITFFTVRLAPGAVLAGGQYLCVDGDCGNEINAIDAIFPDNPSQLMHIFRDAVGHLSNDNFLNRDLLLRTVSPDNFIKMDKYGNLIFSRLLTNGTEVWVHVYEGIIQNGGVNQIPFWH